MFSRYTCRAITGLYWHAMGGIIMYRTREELRRQTNHCHAMKTIIQRNKQTLLFMNQCQDTFKLRIKITSFSDEYIQTIMKMAMGYNTNMKSKTP